MSAKGLEVRKKKRTSEDYDKNKDSRQRKYEKRERRRIKALVGTKKDMYDDCYNLDMTIAIFVLPRIKFLKARRFGYPGEEGMTMEKWGEILDEMIWTFDHISNKSISFGQDMNKEIQDRVQNGLNLFAKYFRSLWL